MPLTELLLVLAITVNACIGLAVYITNTHRKQNRALLVFALSFSAWGACVYGVVTSSGVRDAEFFIRLASYVSAVVPIAFHFLCIAIEKPHYTFPEMLRRAKLTVISSQAIGILICTSFFLKTVTMPGAEGSLHQAPEPIYGPGFLIFTLYFPLVFGAIIYRFFRARHAVKGLQRAEVQYVLLAMAVALVIGTITNLILPALTGSAQTQPLGPLSVIALNGIIAYGIATRRIMDVTYLLRRGASYALLGVYLVGLYAVVWWGSHAVIEGLLHITSPLPHLLAALALAFSVAPVHGRMQRVANRLFVTSASMDVGTTVGEVNDLLQSIRTIPNLLQRFSTTVASSVGTDQVVIFLKNHDGLEEKYPKTEGEQAPRTMEEHDPLYVELKASREPVVLEELSRMRPTPRIKAISRRMQELEAAVAVGVRSPEQLEGMMLLGPKMSGRFYGSAELDALPILCDQLAVSIENAELYTQTRDDKIYNEVLLDNLTSGIIAAGVNGRISVINREAQRITGLSPDDVIDQPLDKLPAPLARAIEDTFRTGHGLRDKDLVLTTGSGPDIPIRVGTSAFNSYTGKLLGALILFTDLTTIKKLEAQVRRTDRLASVGTLAAGMAHEIKNPLVTVKTFTQLLPERYQDEDFRGTFSTLIGQEVRRIDSIVNQLLNFARPAKPDLVPIHLHDVLQGSIKLMSQQAKQKNISVKSDLNASNDAMQADADMLRQALLNFFLNALDSMEPGGELTVTTSLLKYDRRHHAEFDNEDEARLLHLTIQDTGKGISQEDLANIFDPFFTTKGHGTGLGLSVSHGIIQDHGGDIDVESVLGEGTSFHIVFPLRVEERVT